MNDSLENPISKFWTRILAMSLDSILLGVVGAVLGFSLFDMFAQMGVWARLVGFPIAFFYFGILNSGIGNGQTF